MQVVAVGDANKIRRSEKYGPVELMDRIREARS